MKLNLNLRKNKARSESFNNTEFCRVIESIKFVHNQETGTDDQVTRKAIKILTTSIGTRKHFVTLIPMKSLSLEEFTFPFSNSTKIREALKLQVLPFSAAGELEIFPVVLSKVGRGVNGLVWYVSPEELDIPSLPSNKVWPAPLAFISELKKYAGSGVTMWLDEMNVSSILWQNYKPVLSRWRKLVDDSSRDKELAWYDNYCKVRELDRGGDFIIDCSGDYDDSEPDGEFIEMINESVNICPWIANVNLSRTAIQGERDLERTVKLLTRVASWLLIIGVITLGASFLKWHKLQTQTQEIRARSENFYKQTFEPERTGRIANPVTLARDKIAEISGTGNEGHPIEEVLADLGEIYANNKDLNNVTLDIIRYNSEGLDCTGSAPDMSTVLNFRKAWEEYVSVSQVDNTQFVSGIGYRFDLRVRW